MGMILPSLTPLQYGEKLGLHSRALHAQNLEGQEVLENLRPVMHQDPARDRRHQTRVSLLVLPYVQAK